MKKGFATSAILYTLLLLFMVIMVGILNNLENKKTILDALKQDTINALEQDTVTDAILDQIAIINNKILELENSFQSYQNNHEFQERTFSFFGYPGSGVIYYNNELVILDISFAIENKIISVGTSYELGTIPNWEFGSMDFVASPLSYDTTHLQVTIDENGKMKFGTVTYTGNILSWFLGYKIKKYK